MNLFHLQLKDLKHQCTSAPKRSQAYGGGAVALVVQHTMVGVPIISFTTGPPHLMSQIICQSYPVLDWNMFFIVFYLSKNKTKLHSYVDKT